MRVPNVWRSPWKVTGRAPATLSAALKRLSSLDAVQRPAGVGVAEHEVVVGLVARSAAKWQFERGRDAVGERHRAARAQRLRRAVLAAHVVAPHPHATGEPVDVEPAQREQLALP